MIRIMTCAVVATMSMEAAMAALVIPSDGSDGALVVTSNRVIDLSLAANGNWSDPGSGNGVYDASKWAVVFKYTSVTINAGCTVTFKNHLKKAPVVWLVQSNVTINGTVNLNGQDQLAPPRLAEPGPGGFRGGNGYYGYGVSQAAGFGPGGGPIQVNGNSGYGGSYGTQGAYGPPTYGNPSLLPLLGGSGGAGLHDPYERNRSGGAGGGAVLIAAAGVLANEGNIWANGGSGNLGSGSGSGGGIRLIGERIQGAGNIYAIGGSDVYGGGLGRISVERVTASQDLRFNPGPNVVQLTNGATPQIWLPEGGPAVRIVSIGGQPAPVDPSAEFGAVGADTVLPMTGNVAVVVETTAVETNSVLTVRGTPRANGNYTETNAVVSLVVSNSPLVLRWTANLPVLSGYSAFQVKVVRP